MPTPADTSSAVTRSVLLPPASKPKEWDSFNYYSNTSKFAVSFLKADVASAAAKKENDWAFHYLPKIDRKYSRVEQWNNATAATSKEY